MRYVIDYKVQVLVLLCNLETYLEFSQTGSRVHPANPMGTGGYFPGGKITGA
jgi:hypothetical protein